MFLAMIDEHSQQKILCFLRFSIPEKFTLIPKTNLSKRIILKANIFPHINVLLFGKINVGIANIKTITKVV